IEEDVEGVDFTVIYVIAYLPTYTATINKDVGKGWYEFLEITKIFFKIDFLFVFFSEVVWRRSYDKANRILRYLRNEFLNQTLVQNNPCLGGIVFTYF